MSIQDYKITQADLTGKGNVGMPDTPNLTTQQMQEKLDELSLDVIIPAFNDLVDYLNANVDVDHAIKAADITNLRLDTDGKIQVSTDHGETWVTGGASGHLIMDGSGTTYPARSRLQFSQNAIITDNATANKTFISVQGEKGDRGDAATIRVGEVYDSDVAEVENVGSPTDAIFNFGLPKGDSGDAATIRVGTVTGGETASVYNTGTSSDAVFNFVLPKGDKGDDGTGLTILDIYPTYAALVAAHPTGQRGQAYYVGNSESGVVYLWSTESNSWVNIGDVKGVKGDKGDSATVTVGTVTEGNTVSVENVGTSTDAVFNFTLKKGDKGDQGNAGTIAVGTVTGGETASVTNVGTATQAVFNFVIPKGDKGDKGNPTVVNGKTGEVITITASDMVTTGYTPAESYTPIETTDTVNEALAKLEARTFDPGIKGRSIIIVKLDSMMTQGLYVSIFNLDTDEAYSHVITAEEVTAGEFVVEVNSIGQWNGRYQIPPSPATLLEPIVITFHGTYTMNGSRANDSDRNLMANNLPFRFGYDSETQQYGYILPDGEGGADTVYTLTRELDYTKYEYLSNSTITSKFTYTANKAGVVRFFSVPNNTASGTVPVTKNGVSLMPLWAGLNFEGGYPISVEVGDIIVAKFNTTFRGSSGSYFVPYKQYSS